MNEINDSPFTMISNTCDYYQPSDVKNMLTQDRNSLSLFCLNCQGLKAHWDSFCNLVSDMHGELYKNVFDLIGITELYSMSRGEYSLDGYHALEFKTRNDTSGSRGGVGMYIKNDLDYRIRDDLSVFIPNIFESIFLSGFIFTK